MRYEHVHIVINPAAGRSQPILASLNRAFQDVDLDWTTSVTKGSGDARRFAEQAVEGGAESVGVYGGDGTVMEVAEGLLETGIPMAILPGGTGNLLSIELGIPQDLAAACQLLSDPGAKERHVDVGIAHSSDQEGHFLLRLAMGFGALFSSKADRELKDRMGRLAYLLSALQALQESEIARYRVTVDGEEIDAEGLMCTVANAGTIGIPGLSLAPDIRLDDGILDVFVISRADVETLAAIVSSIMGGGQSQPALQHWRGREIQVSTQPVQHVEGDGERLGHTPVRVGIRRRGLKVVVPAAAPGHA